MAKGFKIILHKTGEVSWVGYGFDGKLHWTKRVRHIPMSYTTLTRVQRFMDKHNYEIDYDGYTQI